MFEGIQLRRKKALWEMEMIESQRSTLHMLEEALSDTLANRNSLKDSDEAQWEKTSDPTKNLDLQDQQTMQQQAMKFFYRTAHGRGIIRLYEKYVVGRGFALAPRAKSRQVSDYWTAFWRKNHMERRKKEIVRRTMREGEMFLRFFKDKDGIPVVRFVNPETVKEPDAKAQGIVGNPSYGIETDNNDVENVLAYWIKGKRVPAEEILHDKIFVDSDVKRGRSIFEPIMPRLTQYDTWLSDRMRLNKIRSSIGLIKQVTGSPAQAANIAAQTKTSSVRQADGSYMQKLMDGINMIVANKGVDYKFISPDVQAADVQSDGRALLLTIAAGLGLSEPMVTGDASNANYSCESADTEALTARGWVDQAELRLDDMLATVNRKTGVIEYQRPLRIHRYYHEGKMIHIKGCHNLDILVTENHRLWVTQHQMRKRGGRGGVLIRDGLKAFQFTEAGKLGLATYIVQSTVAWQGCTPECFTLPGINRHRDFIPSVWTAFLGYWLSEGWLLDNGSKRWVVGLSQKRGVIADRIESVLRRMSVNWQRSYSGTSGIVTWQVMDKALWHWLKGHAGSGAYHKRIPQEVKTWGVAELRVLLDALIDGDGSRVGSHSVYFSVSRRLVDDVMEVAIKAGFIAGVKRQMHSGVWPVAIKRPKTVRIRPALHVRKVDYAGIVWCPEVPNGLFVARRNGIAHIHGNSTLIAEAPAVMEFFDWQDHFAEVFGAIYERVVKYGMSIRDLPEYTMKEVPAEEAIGMDVEAVAPGEPTADEAPPDDAAPVDQPPSPPPPPPPPRPIMVIVKVPVSTECDITFPEITHHDIAAETTALLLQSNAGWLSDRTARAKLGLDYEKEKRNIEEELGETDTRTGEDASGDEELLKSRAAQEEMNAELDQGAAAK